MFKIGFDLDEVIADCFPVLEKKLTNKYGELNLPQEPRTILIEEMTHLTVDQIWECVIETLTDIDSINTVPGSRDFLEIYYQDTKEPIHIITSRNYDECGIETEKWFEKNFPDMEFDITFTAKENSKSFYAQKKEINIFIEDRIKYAKELSYNGILVYMLDKKWNRSIGDREYIIRVKDWAQILFLYKQMKELFK